jgi:REP element-mobilizing transposase RayT
MENGRCPRCDANAFSRRRKWRTGDRGGKRPERRDREMKGASPAPRTLAQALNGTWRSIGREVIVTIDTKECVYRSHHPLKASETAHRWRLDSENGRELRFFKDNMLINVYVDDIGIVRMEAKGQKLGFLYVFEDAELRTCPSCYAKTLVDKMYCDDCEYSFGVTLAPSMRVQTSEVSKTSEVSVEPTRLAYDTIYHIWNRGVNRSTIFREDENYRNFLRQYVKHIEPVAETYAYCLLPNHFHFLIRTRTLEMQRAYRQVGQVGHADILEPSQAFSNLFNGYVRAFNRRYSRSGGLFEDRFGRKRVTSDGYLAKLVVYIHQNPQKHGLVEDFRLWRYSSFQGMAAVGQTRISRDEVLSWFGNFRQFVSAHREDADLKDLRGFENL